MRDSETNPKKSTDQSYAIASAVQKACIIAAEDAYESGGLSGLCQEGRWDLAMDALRSLDLNSVLEKIK